MPTIKTKIHKPVKPTRGGVRAGAGAPRKHPDAKRVDLQVRIPAWLLEATNITATYKNVNRTEIVIAALTKYLKVKEPEHVKVQA